MNYELEVYFEVTISLFRAKLWTERNEIVKKKILSTNRSMGAVSILRNKFIKIKICDIIIPNKGFFYEAE
jgi:hypothetical protein